MKLVYLENDRPVTDSLMVAETFGKRHDDVLKSIRELECSEDFSLRNFAESTYTNDRGRTYPKYIITQDGFAFLVMGYTGKEAARFKEMYINEFNRMRQQLSLQQFNIPQNLHDALLLATNLEAKRVKLEEEKLLLEQKTIEQQVKLKEQEAPVAIYNLALSARNTMTMQEVAKSLNTGRTRLFRILREEGIIMKNSTMPYQRYLDAGYFKVTERPRASGDTVINDPATRVYPKGFDFIARLMQKRAEKSGQST